jgi:ABC-2 type transport system permease protein
LIRVVAVLVAKDLRRKLRSPLGFLVALAFPLLFSALIALTFGRTGSGVPKVRLLVENRDDGLLGKMLLSAATSERMAEHFDVKIVGREGLAAIGRGDASALLVVPPGFTRGILDGQPVTLQLVKNPSEAILPVVAEQIAGLLAEGLDAAAHLLRGPLDELAPFVADGSGSAPSEEGVSRVAVSVHRAIAGSGRYLFPPAITLDGIGAKAADRPGGSGSSDAFGSIFLVVLAGVSVYGMFMVGDQAMRDLLTEAEAGTLRRQLAAPVSAGTLLAGKVVFTAVLSCGSLLLLAAIAWSATTGRVSLAGFAVLSLSLVLAITGTSAAIYGAARNQRRGATISAVLYLVFGFAGGAFVPSGSLPAAVRRIAPASPFYWASDGYQALLSSGAGVAEITSNAAVLFVMGSCLLALGAFLLRRSVMRGGTA